MRIFYSWQSDLPNKTNRGLILDALELAAKQIREDETLEVSPVIDRDTLGRPGAPAISEAIFDKIAQSDVFVADVSIINSDTPAERQTPNPNVLIELGYAVAVVGWDNIIPVQNTAFGMPTDLPFDLRHRKATCCRMVVDEEPKTARKLLSHSLKSVLLDIIVNADKGPQPILVGLSMTDSDYLREVFGLTLARTGMHNLIEASDFDSAASALGLTIEDALESIEILGDNSLIEIHYHHGGGLPSGKLTGFGLGLCMEHFFPSGLELEVRVLSAYVNNGYRNGQAISTALASNFAATNYALSDLEYKGFLILDSYLGSQSYEVSSATVKGKRAARG